MTDKYKAKGQIIFRLGSDGIQTQIVNDLYRGNFEKDIYDLFDGKEFLEHVQDGYITDYDGSIATVFVDGYISNLGLATDNLTQGKFLVSAEVWKDICNEFKIEVNWANK